MATRPMDAPSHTAPAPAPAPAAPAKRRINPLLIVGVLALLAAAWGVTRWLHGRNHVETDNAQIDGHVTPIAPKVQAFVSRVLVDDNLHVKPGDTLVVLDDRDFRTRLEQARAELATAQAAAGAGRGVGQAEAELQASRATASSAGAAVRAAEAQARRALADLQRYRGLAQQKIVSQQQLDAAQATADAAQANLDAARRQAAAGGSNVAAAAAGVTAAQARVEAAQSAVEAAQTQLGYTVITAPTAGVVAKRRAEPGELVQPGQQLLTIVPTDSLWVTANLKETELADVTPGDAAEFTVDAYPGVTFRGKVESVSPATGARFSLLPPDNATGNFTKVVQRVPARVAVDGRQDPAHPLRPGMSVDITITTK
jgi:membrane fusion protein, multidrug efflux system